MDLIALYVKEVGRNLPEKSREDIQQEIRSLIEDTLEDRAKGQNKPVNDDLVIEVLTELGPPEKMAASYLPPRYLIGPRLYSYFIKTLRVVLSVITVLAAIGAGVSLAYGAKLPVDVAQGLWQAVLGLVDYAFRAFAIIVIVFAVLERTQPNVDLGGKAWDPRKLHDEPDPERYKPSDLIGKLIGDLVAITLFNFYPQWIGFSMHQGGQWLHVSVLTPVFFQYLPWMSGLWVLEAGLMGLVLAQGKWQTITRWVSIALNIGNIFLLGWILVGPAIVAIDPATFAQLGWSFPSADALRTSNDALQNVMRVILGITIALQALELGKSLYRLLLRRKVEASGILN
jgi:hypothetical protein